MKFIINIFLFLSIVYTVKSDAQVTITNYTASDGLAHNLCYQLLESNDGYLYIGTDNGLSKYDGRKFETVYLGNNSTKFIIDVKQSKSNDIYLGTWGNGIQVLNRKGTAQPLNPYDTLARYARSFFIKDNYYGFDALRVLTQYRRDNWQEINKFSFSIDKEKLCLYDYSTNIKNKGQIISQLDLGVYDDQLLIFNAEGFSFFKGVYSLSADNKISRKFSFLDDRYIQSLQETKNGYTAHAENNIIFFNKNGIIKEVPTDIKKIKKYIYNGVFTCFIQNAGKGDNLIIENNTNKKKYEFESKIFRNELISDILFTNGSKILWVSTYGSGLFKIMLADSIFSENKFKGKNITEHLHLKDVNYYTTNTELFSTNAQLELKHSLPIPRIHKLYYDSSIDALLVLNAPNRAQRYTIGTRKVLANNFGQYEYIYNDINVHVGEESMTMSKNGIKKIIDLKPYFKNTNSLKAIQSLGYEGGIAILSNKGFILIDTATLKVKFRLDSYNSINTQDFKSMSLNKKGLWIVNQSQLIKIHQGKVQVFNYENKLNDYINKVHAADNGLIWLSTQKGLVCFDNGLFRIFTKKEGLLADFTNDIYQSSEGKITAITNNGLIEVKHDNFKFIPKPKIILSNNYFNDREVIKINPKDSLEIKANVINFYSSDVQIQMKLNENQWAEYDYESIQFENYQTGVYTLQFRARYNHTDYVYSRILTVEKENYWYLKSEFIVLWALLFCAIVWAFMRWRILSLKRKSDYLKNLITQNETLQVKLTEMRKEVAQDFHDELGNKIAGITSLSDKLIHNNNQSFDKGTVAVLNRIHSDSQLLYSTVKDYIWSIDSNNNQLQSLINGISDFGSELFSLSNISYKVDVNIIDTSQVLPFQWSRQILLIFKESITNAFKHAEASNVTIYFHLAKNKLCITINDDGQGFDIDNLERKNGLNNIFNRAKKIGASIEIQTNEGGTSIIFESADILKYY